MTNPFCTTLDPTNNNNSNNNNIGNQAAFIKGKKWPVGSEIKIGFIKGTVISNGNKYDAEWSKDKQDFTIDTVNKYISPLVNLSFKWDVPINEAEVRISFNKDLGAFSYLGTDCLSFKNTKEPTLNLGWLNDDKEQDDDCAGTGAVVLHEFGHLLGMIHEHSRSDAKLEWNKDKVYADMKKAPNYWTEEQVDSQIFEKVSNFNGSKYDKHSIMHYWYPDKYFKNKPHLERVCKLSDLDKEWMSKEYPGKKKCPNGEDTGSKCGNHIKNSETDNVSKTFKNKISKIFIIIKNWLKKNWYVLLIILGVINLIFLSTCNK